jgi:hypothetical protein
MHFHKPRRGRMDSAGEKDSREHEWRLDSLAAVPCDLQLISAKAALGEVGRLDDHEHLSGPLDLVPAIADRLFFLFFLLHDRQAQGGGGAHQGQVP